VETPGCNALFVAIPAALKCPGDELQTDAVDVSSHA
jgi:hypothetical protein